MSFYYNCVLKFQICNNTFAKFVAPVPRKIKIIQDVTMTRREMINRICSAIFRPLRSPSLHKNRLINKSTIRRHSGHLNVAFVVVLVNC